MSRKSYLKSALAAGVCALALTATGAAAAAETRKFDVPAGDLGQALDVYAKQSGAQLIYRVSDVSGVRTAGARGELSSDEALAQLLSGTSFKVRRDPSGAIAISQEEGGSPQGASAGGDVEALIVTAQKREENIQDVPIAISAFSARDLEAQKIEGGFDLLKAIPNVTFSKNNFTSYNFSIRGVGTKAVSATTDPGVAVAFNSTTLIQNRLFEQEYFDVQRVEVLRGPQGTLYGRNATSGVINVISARPNLREFDGWVKGEVGNHHTKRLSAMVNIPLVEDRLAVRIAGALTDRAGYDFNSVTKNAVNGRDLWSGRVTVGFEVTDRLRGDLIWERFEEDDNRSRTGKQLCHRDDGPTMIGNVELADGVTGIGSILTRRGLFSQGCKAGSLYDEAAFGTPNGLSYNFILGMFAIKDAGFAIGRINGRSVTILQEQDPYGGLMQSPDLRTIASFRDPIYRAGADLVQLNLEYDLTDSITIYSQTAYDKDSTYSFQDYNRFNTLPIFTDTSQISGPAIVLNGNSDWRDLAPGGVFCDPQLGCSKTLAGFDISSADGEQFSQEFRVQSSFDGPLNFSLGLNYTEFETDVNYYIMYNILTAIAQIAPFNTSETPYETCVGATISNGAFVPVTMPSNDPNAPCPYIDPNPVESIDGQGHNYFRSRNPYDLKSTAAFGEAYWQIDDALKLTVGLRYTDDRKNFIPVPSQVLNAASLYAGGDVAYGYPEDPPIKQKWGEWTGRIGLDWKPNIPFTDQSMLYAFYSRGYKGGGANPPSPDFATLADYQGWIDRGILDQFSYDTAAALEIIPVLELTAVEYERTFDAEFVDAFEIGAKNTLLDGAMTLNLTGFYYDYKDYQVSQIRDRTAVNENFDAEVWGVEVETMFSPSRNLQITANLGYLDTRIGDGETSIDIMNRTQSDPDYTLVKPWVQLPSNCVVPTAVAESWAATHSNLGTYWTMCGGFGGLVVLFPQAPIDPETGQPYDVDNYPELNGGAGIRDDLGGNELPNAPHWTANLGAQYGFDFLDGWRATVRGDLYWQSQSWHRVYNADPYDKLHGWYNANLSVWIERPDDGLKIELYAKNLLDDTPITDAFLNSDDTGLTTNVFTLDPRLIGLSIRKSF